jgi:hypothetical protein
MKVQLTRLRVKDGMSSRVDEWFASLNARRAECIETLEREKMYVETIFREKVNGEEFLYWFSIQGEGGEGIETSPFPIDAIHREFGRECVDRSHPRTDWDAEVVLIAPHVQAAIENV